MTTRRENDMTSFRGLMNGNELSGACALNPIMARIAEDAASRRSI